MGSGENEAFSLYHDWIYKVVSLFKCQWNSLHMLLDSIPRSLPALLWLPWVKPSNGDRDCQRPLDATPPTHGPPPFALHAAATDALKSQWSHVICWNPSELSPEQTVQSLWGSDSAFTLTASPLAALASSHRLASSVCCALHRWCSKIWLSCPPPNVLFLSSCSQTVPSQLLSLGLPIPSSGVPRCPQTGTHSLLRFLPQFSPTHGHSSLPASRARQWALQGLFVMPF